MQKQHREDPHRMHMMRLRAHVASLFSEAKKKGFEVRSVGARGRYEIRGIESGERQLNDILGDRTTFSLADVERWLKRMKRH